ncbi:hypothetical protein [Tepidiforma sp.]|uniref:hypothetical protein n=1 Tax=Tepidiforma sp. TaxID=2682230 RepID=UPI002590AEE8|nr:hypothetical protein [Tepidiforma sp.]
MSAASAKFPEPSSYMKKAILTMYHSPPWGTRNTVSTSRKRGSVSATAPVEPKSTAAAMPQAQAARASRPTRDRQAVRERGR